MEIRALILCIRRHVTLVYSIYPPLFTFQPEHSLEASCLQTILVWTWRWAVLFISGGHLWTCVYGRRKYSHIYRVWLFVIFATNIFFSVGILTSLFVSFVYLNGSGAEVKRKCNNGPCNTGNLASAPAFHVHYFIAIFIIILLCMCVCVCVCVFQCQPTALLCASGSMQGG